ncbi:MAG: MarC family protein [Actinobacteria bacterium]|nr:MarC family protein [bacterium]MBU1228277.1 MarC family protein [Actinomycetota bacterium]MBU1674535.1 MarC family protein [bacterium]
MGTAAFVIFAFSSLFAVIDPLGCIPFFSGLTSDLGRAQQRRVLLRALAVAFCVLLVFTLFGHALLNLFGITIEAFRIAGGVIFFGIGLDMLQSKPQRWRTGIRKAYARDQEEHEDVEDEDPSVTPLAIPLIAGPGSITTVMVLASEAPAGPLAKPLILGSVLAILLITGAILMGADLVIRRVGRTGLRIVEKLMGLLVTVIAVQLIIDGFTPVIRNLID